MGLVSMGVAALGSRPAFASEEAILDAAAITQLEQQASTAQVKDQCFLYTEVLHSLTEIAGKQLADGQDEEAAVTFHHIDTITAKIQHALAKDAKRLKNAEMLMEHTTRRLSDMLHVTNGDERTALQGTLQRVSAVHSQLLSQVFAK
ncbi:MAG TPA: hypothetical protein VGN16_00520 [Acidobacteriaceae bacterium]